MRSARSASSSPSSPLTRARRALDPPEPAHDRHRHPLAGDREVPDRLVRLAAPELLSRRHPRCLHLSQVRLGRYTRHTVRSWTPLTRRHLIQRGALATGAVALGPAFWRRSLSEAATPGAGPYGALGPPDANGLRLPEGFTSRLIARGNEIVAGTTYRFPVQPDGQATFATADGGWILVTNSEFAPPDGGVSATRFDAVRQDRRRLPDPRPARRSTAPAARRRGARGCPARRPTAATSGSATRRRPSQGVRRAALGSFKHEAVAVDSAGQRLYLTEDTADGNLYRFTPAAYPALDAGVLEVAVVAADGTVTLAAGARAEPGAERDADAQAGARGDAVRARRGDLVRLGRRLHRDDRATRASTPTTPSASASRSSTTARRSPTRRSSRRTTSPSRRRATSSSPRTATRRTAGSTSCCSPPTSSSRAFLSAVGGKHVYNNLDPRPERADRPGLRPVGDALLLHLAARRATATGGDEPGTGEVYEITGPFRTARPDERPAVAGQPARGGAGRRVGPGAVARARSSSAPALGIEVPRRISWAQLRRARPAGGDDDRRARARRDRRQRPVRPASPAGARARSAAPTASAAEPSSTASDGPVTARVRFTGGRAAPDRRRASARCA